jgi:hypothetical protein
LLAKMLAKNAGDRFQDYHQLITAVRRLTESGARHLLPWAAAVLGLLVLSAASVYFAGAHWRQPTGTSARELFASAYSRIGAEPDALDQLEYVFSRYKTSLPPGLRFSARTADDLAKPPGLIGNDLRWSNFSEFVEFPPWSDIEQLRLTGLRFAGTPDFELRMGYDRRRPQDVLRLVFSIGHDNRQRNHALVEFWHGGQRLAIVTEPRLEECTFDPNVEYRLLLQRESESLGAGHPTYTLRVEQRTGGRWVERVVQRFALPAALPAGGVALRCAGDDDWTVYVQEIMIRGRLEPFAMVEWPVQY